VLAFDDADEDRPMALRVPYIAAESIERNAEALLAQYAHAKGVELRAPIPIEDIVEKHLNLRVDFDDLHGLLGVPRCSGVEPDIFGAIWLETGDIIIDESLDPEERPSIEGRYRFTLGHEVGHWRLHRPLVQGHSGQRLLVGDTQRTTVVCRSSQANEPMELQADHYSSSVLMPRKLVMQELRDNFGNDHPRVLRRNGGNFVLCDKEEMAIAGDIVGEARSVRILELARPLAKLFLVSPVAMRVRLAKLGLINRKARQQMLRIQR
jgi:Zn-dependent peptidase ImmA (M78 family)